MVNRLSIINYKQSLSLRDKSLSIKQNAKRLLLHPLFSGSAIMIVGSNLANFFSYIYHVIVGRLLGPAPYGELAAVLSLMGLVTASFTFLGLVIVKFVSSAEEKERQSLFSWFSKKALVFGLILSFLLITATPFLSNFLHINYSTIVLLAPIFLFSLLSFFYRAFLQGILKFKEVVVATGLEILGRLFFGVSLIYLGFSVFGAVFGMFLSSLLGLFVLRFFLKKYRISTAKQAFKGGKKVFSYTVPLFLATVSTYSIFSTDVILVKHFFNPHDAGIYAALSTLGKIIFYGTGPVASVMFPLVSRRHAKGGNYRKIFFMSFLLTAAIAGGVLIIYYFLPQLMVKILYGDKFIEASPNLVWFGLFMSIFSLSSLILNFYLSKDVTRVVFFVVAAAIAQAIGIWIFHDSIITVVKVSTASASFLLAALLIYFGYESINKNK